MATTNTVFQLTFPDGWKETTVYTYEGPHDSGIQHNLVLTIDPYLLTDSTLKEYVKKQLEGPRQCMPGFEMLGEVEKKLLDGTPVIEVVYKYTPAENYTLYQKQFYFFREDKGFVFTGTFVKKTLKTIGNEFDAIVESLQLFNPDKR